jgi:CRP-like cAMP-binding protein
MEQYLDLCAENPLFEKIERDDLIPLFDCLDAKKKDFARGTVFLHTGDKCNQLGIVLSGIVRSESLDILGERSIISYMKPGQLFCDAYSSTRDQTLLLDIVAQTNCTVLLIETHRLLHVCAGAQKYRMQLNENLIHILAQKYVDLGCKVIHLSGRSTRRKILSYLSEQFRFSGGKPFAIPFNQQELADYLFIERSGLSTEFNRLKKEGILTCENGLYFLTVPDPE